MIRRALLLKEALNTYAAQLYVSKDEFDKETFSKDYLSPDKWATLEDIRKQLEPLFYLTKALKGNATAQEKALKASYSALWEVLPVLEHILGHFEQLQNRANNGEFNDRIQASITLA
jgi:hypothetical protein